VSGALPSRGVLLALPTVHQNSTTSLFSISRCFGW
jgi:hypothetical protein